MSDAVRVTIGGQELLVSSEHPPEYTKRVAAHFDAALAAIRAALPSVDSHRAAILAGLAVTDELFQTRQTDDDVARRLAIVTQDLARLVPPTKRGKGRPEATASDH